jgi:hypothetical protein
MSQKRSKLTFGLVLILGLVLSWVPTGRVAAAELCVDPTNPGTCYTTIQDAINNANPGDVITVEAGTYSENVVINKAVTVQGADNPYGASAAAVSGTVDLTADGAVLQNMKVTPGSVTGQEAAVQVSASNTTVSDNLIENMTGDGSGTIKGVHIYDGSAPAITNITIDGNTIQSISNLNTSGTAGTDGIMVQGVIDGVLVSNNTVRILSSEGWAYGIEVTPTGSAPTTPPQNVTIQNNFISTVNATAQPGVGFSIDVAGTTPADASQVTLNYNHFSNGPVAVVNKDPAHTLDATCNWYSDTSGPTEATNNPGGTGMVIGGEIDFAPWLVYDNEGSADPGWQTPASFSVTGPGDVSEALNGFRILENALGCAVDGQTITLSGTFDWSSAGPYANAQYAASFASSFAGDIRGVAIPPGVDDLTITSAPDDAHLTGAGDITETPSALIFSAAFYSDAAPGNTNLTIENLFFDDFEGAVTLGWNATGTFHGTTLQNNEVILAGDDGDGTDWIQNIAFYFWNGTNQTLQNNTVTFQADGTRTEGYFGPKDGSSFGYQCGTTGGSAYDGLVISGNTFQVGSGSNGLEETHGIWENSHNDTDGTSLQLVNNQFLGRTGDDFDHAFHLSSQTDGLVISGNILDGVDEVFSATRSQGHTAGDEFTFTGNILTNVGGSDGIFLQNVTNDTTPVTVNIFWDISNSIDGETGIRGLIELSTDAVHANRAASGATDIDAVFALPIPVDPVFVDDDWAGEDRFSNPDELRTADLVVFEYNGFATIQAGIDAAVSGGTVNVNAGAYTEDLEIDKALSLLGPNASINPNTETRNPEAVIYPATSAPDPSVCATILYIYESDVTVKGLTFNGDNPAIDSGIIINGADVDACMHVASWEGVGNIVVENNILKYGTYNSICFYNWTDQSATAGNYIRYNLIEDMGEMTYGWGIGILNYNNFYADVTDNVMNRVRTGIQTGNFFRANPGTTGKISNNLINTWRTGIFHNLWYSDASTISVDNNSINAITFPGFTEKWNGILLTSFGGDVNTLVVDNIIDIPTEVTDALTNPATGYHIWNDTTTADLTLSGGSVTGGDFGVWVNNYEGYNSNGGDTAIIVDGLFISNADVGVNIWVSPSATNDATIEATVQNSTIINATTAIQVNGSDATGLVKGNTLDTIGTVFYQDEGLLTAYANNITGFTTGMDIVSGTADARHNWWGLFDTNPGTIDADAWDYRLGAEVWTWADGSTGTVTLADSVAGADASLTLESGPGGTMVLVNHGPDMSPFDKHLTRPQACSDYYDVFVIGGDSADTYALTLPVSGSCPDPTTMASPHLLRFALTDYKPDPTCTDCWIEVAGTATSSDITIIGQIAQDHLGGTPFTAPYTGVIYNYIIVQIFK